MNTVINHEMNVILPEGFHTLSDEEKKNFKMIEEGDGSIFSDPQRHIVLSIAYRKAGLFTGLADPKDAIKAMEKKVAAPMQSFGYVLDGFTERKIGGEDTYGFCYHYTAQDTAMSGESMILKRNRTFWYIHCYYRTALAEESRKVLAEILDSVSFA